MSLAASHAVTAQPQPGTATTALLAALTAWWGQLPSLLLTSVALRCVLHFVPAVSLAGGKVYPVYQLSFLFLMAFAVIRVDAARAGRNLPVHIAWWLAAIATPRLAWAWTRAICLNALALVFFVLPGIYVFFRLATVTPVAVLDQHGPEQAWNNTEQLGHAVVTVPLLAGTGAHLLQLAGDARLSRLAHMSTADIELWVDLLSQVNWDITTVFVTIAMYQLYIVRTDAPLQR